MQYSSFTKTLTGTTILLKNELPIEQVGRIISYSEVSKTGSFTKIEFRWSFTGNYWSSWQTLTQNAISNINTNDNYYLFLEIRYVFSTKIKVLVSAGS